MNWRCPNAHADNQANILITRDSRACLADLDLSTIRAPASASLTSLHSTASLIPSTVGGTIRWTSPELLYPDMFGIIDDRPTKESDCYALGMTVYEVCVNASTLS